VATSAPEVPQPVKPRLWRERPAAQKVREAIIEGFLFFCGVLSILITAAIVVVIITGSADFFADPKVDVLYFFTGTEWSAGFQDAKYGVLPLVVGTLLVAVIAGLIALPIGLMTAIYLSEYASPRVRAFAKPTLEILAGIPTVVYGYFALQAITPFLQQLIPGVETYNQLSGGIIVGIMIIPMVASLSEDALRAVPRSLRDASYALAANKFQTSTRVVVPAALSGIIASFILALSRAIGETMAVAIACGESANFTLDPRQGVMTMTSFIASTAKGEVEHGTTDYASLFAVAGTLFVITLLMNIIAQWILRRYRQVYQ
jgi:phosphate transport system permease protein